MRSIYIRHADKNYLNGCSEYFKHDPGITESGVSRAKHIALELINLYGQPDRIVTSPFRRTRETALVMNSVLNRPLDEIEVDVNLSEYLGNHYNVPLDVMEHTKIYRPPHPENFEQMKLRVKNHLKKIKKSNVLTWFITHGLIIKQIAGHYNIKTSKQIPYLTCFSVTEKEEIVRAEFVLFKKVLLNHNETEEYSSKPILPTKEVFHRKNENFRPTIDLFLVSPQETNSRDDLTGRV
jgi:broad specificity phosphatase PhoE